MIGTTLDKYEVLQKVGEGGMATVYRGRHATLNRDVAIKVLHPHLSSSTRNRKRFAREARAIEHLRHENILEIFDYSGADAEECYIVTEFVEGETLTDLLNRHGRVPSEVAAILGSKLARALGYAHAAGILHRDIKPDNVMVRLDGTVKLMDFGIARFLDESQVTMTGALVGSPAYMSPEQAAEKDLDVRSDLFSLGTLLYHLVTGHLPFSGTNPSIILKNIVEGNRPAVTELAPAMSATLADVVERLLQTDREARFDSADDVAAALDKVLEETSIDPSKDEWSIVRYLREPEVWQRHLEQHLSTALVERGKRYLAEGDHLAALRLFNRLLAMDEDNAEVLALVQGLHQEPEPARSPSRRWMWSIGLGAAGLAALTAVVVGLVGGETSGPPPTADAAAPLSRPPPTPDPAVTASAATADPALRVVAPADPVPVGEPAPSADKAASSAVRSRPKVSVPETPTKLDVAATPAGPADDGPMTVVVGSDLIADVACAVPDTNGGSALRKVATTRSGPFSLPSGNYTCEATGPKVEDHPFSIEGAPGETVRYKLDLVARPGRLAFEQCDGACRVALDGHDQGTVGDLSAGLEVPSPDEPHKVVLTCGDGSPQELSMYASYLDAHKSFLCAAP